MPLKNVHAAENLTENLEVYTTICPTKMYNFKENTHTHEFIYWLTLGCHICIHIWQANHNSVTTPITSGDIVSTDW